MVFPLEEYGGPALFVGSSLDVPTRYYFLSPLGLTCKHESYVMNSSWIRRVASADFVSAPE